MTTRQPDSSYRVTATPNTTMIQPKVPSGGSWWLCEPERFSDRQRIEQQRMSGQGGKAEAIGLVPR